MFRLRTLVLVAGVFAALCGSALPASASQWKANSSAEKQQTGEGHVNVIAAGEFVDEELKVKCEAKEVKAYWSIQTKGQIKKHQIEQKQLKWFTGPQLYIQIQTWGNGCKAEIGSSKVAVEVSPCEFQLKAVGFKEADGGVASQCTLKATGLCEVSIPAGMETAPESGQGLNVGLKEITLTDNKTTTQLDKINVQGIRGEKPANPLCPLHLVQTNAKLTGVELEIVGATIEE